MRTDFRLVVLPAAFFVAACTSHDTSSPAKKSTASAELTTVPQSYQRMRFVSDLEQAKSSAPAAQSQHSKQPDGARTRRSVASNAVTVAPDPMAEMMSHAPVATVTSQELPPVLIAVNSPSTAVVPARVPSDEGGLDHGGASIGDVLSGIGQHVVIRGGHAGTDKCDPRTDGRINGTIGERPSFGMPLPTGQVFGGGRHR